MSTTLTHSHVYNGKRRCLTGKMPIQHHQALKQIHREARLNSVGLVPDHEVIHVGVVFHVLTPVTSRTFQDAMDACQPILHSMKAGFGHAFSPMHNLEDIENGPLLRYDPMHSELFARYKKLAYSPNLDFVMAQKPRLYYIPFAHKHSGSDTQDMDYWDHLLKLEMAPAYDPEHLYNIWIVMDIKSVLLGYGNFPKINPTSKDIALDGFVYFLSGPPYDLHFTAVHESGHVWALNHLFNHDDRTGEYEDGIEDTPYQDVPDFGPMFFKSQKWPHSVDPRGNKSYHLLMNYMNYVDDKCMFMFTRGQCRKIRDTALTVRSGWNLQSSEAMALRGGSAWISARLMDKKRIKDTLEPLVPKKEVPKEESKIDLKEQKTIVVANDFQTTHDPFPFRPKYIPPERRFPGKTTKLPETKLSTFGGVLDLCGSLCDTSTWCIRKLDSTGKMISALSFACC